MSLIDELTGIAPLLNQRSMDADAGLSYDVMSDALIWSDELPDLTTIPLRKLWCLRPVFRYRTSLIQEQPDERFLDFWNAGRALFPDWPGFAPDRREPGVDLQAKLERFKADAGCW